MDRDISIAAVEQRQDVRVLPLGRRLYLGREALATQRGGEVRQDVGVQIGRDHDVK